MVKGFFQDMGLQQPAICPQQLVERHAGLAPHIGRSGQQDKLLARQ